MYRQLCIRIVWCLDGTKINVWHRHHCVWIAHPRRIHVSFKSRNLWFFPVLLTCFFQIQKQSHVSFKLGNLKFMFLSNQKNLWFKLWYIFVYPTRRVFRIPSAPRQPNVCCRVLPGVTACCSMLQRVAACCSVTRILILTASRIPVGAATTNSVLQCVAVCCSVLQRVAV